MKPKRRTDFDIVSGQRQTTTQVKRPQFTSNFTVDNKLFYLYLDIIKEK